MAAYDLLLSLGDGLLPALLCL